MTDRPGAPDPRPTATSPTVVRVHPWPDPVVDERGHDPRSAYVETFWLGVIGPTATWVMRRFAQRFDGEPTGFDLDLRDTASSMGLSYAKGTSSPFGRAIQRCVMFGLAHATSDGLAVRRWLPDVPHRHLARLPRSTRELHDTWTTRATHVDTDRLEAQLLAAGLPRPAVVHAVDAAVRAA